MNIESMNEIPVDPNAADFDAMFERLVAGLAGVDPFADAVERLAALDREEAARFAERASLYADLVGLHRAELGVGVAGGPGSLELAIRSLTAELAIALRLSDRTIQARISESVRLVEDFPFTHFALEGGELSVAKARIVMEAGAAIADRGSRADFETAVIERAAGVTPARFRRVVKLAAERFAGVSFEARHELAMEARAVRSFEVGDGMSEVVATIPTVLAAGVMDRLTAMANAVLSANPGDSRTLDQVRADLFCELQLSGEATGEVHAAAAGIRAEISIVVPALAILGRSDEPATILGGGPIGLADAVRLAADAPSLVRVLTDPVTDVVLATDTYRPSEKLRRFLRMRDGRCRCPSCNRAAWRCDIDHTIPFAAGGPTAAGNLAHLCQGHHTIKHIPGWAVRQLSPGVLEWTTPHGFIAVDRPDTAVQFSG